MTKERSDSLRLQSLRCLFASVASLEVMDHLLKSKRLHLLTNDGDDIEDVLFNIRLYFIAGPGLSKEEMRDRYTPIIGLLPSHIYSVLFSDAVRWWAAAHRTGQDENKYLRSSMYSSEFVDYHHHFYHEFRNNQLAHFPQITRRDELPFLTPSPYGFFLSKKEYDDFRSLLAYSIQLTVVEDKLETLEEILVSLPEYNQLSEVEKQALMDAANKVKRWQSEAFLKVPTHNRFPEADNDQA